MVQRKVKERATDAAGPRVTHGIESRLEPSLREIFQPLAQGSQMAPSHFRQVRTRDQVKKPGPRRLLALHRLDLKSVSPSQQGTPDELIQRDDHRRQCTEAGSDGAQASPIGRDLEIGAEAREAKIARAHVKYFGRHQKEPASGPAHHAVPNEGQARKREVQRFHPEEGIEPEDCCRFTQLTGNGLQRLVKAESQVPNL